MAPLAASGFPPFLRTSRLAKLQQWIEANCQPTSVCVHCRSRSAATSATAKSKQINLSHSHSFCRHHRRCCCLQCSTTLGIKATNTSSGWRARTMGEQVGNRSPPLFFSILLAAKAALWRRRQGPRHCSQFVALFYLILCSLNFPFVVVVLLLCYSNNFLLSAARVSYSPLEMAAVAAAAATATAPAPVFQSSLKQLVPLKSSRSR